MKSVLVFFGTLSVSAIAGGVLWWSKVFTNIELGLIAAFLLLGFSQIATQIRTHRERAAIPKQSETEILNAKILELKQNATVWDNRFDELETRLETVAHARNDQLIAEMQMVETLVKQLAERVAIDGLEAMDPDSCYRAMDWLLEIEAELAEAVYWSVADLLNLEVDLLFFDTTSTYFETEQADERLIDVGHLLLEIQHERVVGRRLDLPARLLELDALDL